MEQEAKSSGKRIVITVIGQDRIGIIAGVTNVLADNDVNILDISQTILQDLFTMILVADMEVSPLDLSGLKEQLVCKGKELRVRIEVQHEDLFRYMHRV